AYYLAAAGIGSIRIADRDCVEAGNLNRQILHNTSQIGRPKTQSAMETLHSLNPYCDIQPIQENIQDRNILELVEDCLVILDATDNLETRKVLNRASIQKRIPFIYGGVNGFTGMATTLVPGYTPCLECLFPQSEGPHEPVGIIGPVPGVIGSIQSLEAIKLIVGIKGLLKGRMLIFNGMDMTFRNIHIDKNPDCRVCNPSIERSQHE
ncbi:MAG: HesA/MoeB/ThiF family protein, partial [Desulfatirhabdiaceae bacterium]